MCFSANASFAASGALALTGLATLRENKVRRALPLALFPILFGIQQFIEGWQWLSAKPGELSQVLAYAYLFFALVLWPVYVPVAARSVEPLAGKKKRFVYFIALGVAVSLFCLLDLLFFPLEISSEACCHVRYVFGMPFKYVVGACYVAATCGSLFYSSYRWIKLMSAAIFIALVASYAFAELAFISVWCFFAAVLSIAVFFGIRSIKR